MLRVVESTLRHGAELRRSSALRLIARSQSTTPGRTGAARTFALMTAHLPYAPAARELRRPARRAARRSAAAPPKRFVDPLLVALCGAGFGITLGLALAALLPLTLTASGILYAIQSLAACAGAYLVLVEFLLISRAPFIERAIGQDSLAPTHQVELLVRSRDIADLALSAELDALDALPNLRVRTLIGPRAQHPIDAASLAPSIRDPRSIDVYACGPEALLDSVRTAARALGVPADRIHIESFDM